MSAFGSGPPAALAGALFLTATLACATVDTSVLSAEREAELARDTVLYRAPNLTFRYTHDVGGPGAGWEDRVASIAVTRHTVLIYKNEKVGIEITPTSRRFYQVRREDDRVLLNAGSGGAKETWSFVPPDDPDGWTRAVREVIRGSRSVANPD